MADVIYGIIMVAIIMVLVRPNSRASTAVTNFGHAFSALVEAAVAA